MKKSDYKRVKAQALELGWPWGNIADIWEKAEHHCR